MLVTTRPMGGGYGGFSSGISEEIAIILYIVAILAAIVGAILLYCLFLKKSNDERFTGFAGWLYDFLNFKKFALDVILRLCYLGGTIGLTLSSLVGLLEGSFSVLYFLLIITFGNLGLRIMFEFSMLILVICRNTTDINHKLSLTQKNAPNVNVDVAVKPAPAAPAAPEMTAAPVVEAAPAAPVVEAVPVAAEPAAPVAAPAEESALAPASKKFCPQCGHELSDSAMFCPLCGRSLK